MDKYIELINCGKYDIREDGSILILKTGKIAKLTTNKRDT